MGTRGSIDKIDPVNGKQQMDGQSFLLPFVAAMAGGGRLLDMKKAPTGVGAQFSQPRQNLPDPAREKLRLSETRSSTIHEGRPERREQPPIGSGRFARGPRIIPGAELAQPPLLLATPAQPGHGVGRAPFHTQRGTTP
jgi:hypothetical protein